MDCTDLGADDGAALPPREVADEEATFVFWEGVNDILPLLLRLFALGDRESALGDKLLQGVIEPHGHSEMHTLVKLFVEGENLGVDDDSAGHGEEGRKIVFFFFWEGGGR